MATDAEDHTSTDESRPGGITFFLLPKTLGESVTKLEQDAICRNIDCIVFYHVLISSVDLFSFPTLFSDPFIIQPLNRSIPVYI